MGGSARHSGCPRCSNWSLAGTRGADKPPVATSVEEKRRGDEVEGVARSHFAGGTEAMQCRKGLRDYNDTRHGDSGVRGNGGSALNADGRASVPRSRAAPPS